MCLFIPGCAGPRRCPQAFSSWGAGVAPSRGAQVLVCAGSVVGTQALSPGSKWSLSFGTSDRARVPGTGSGHLTPGPAGKPREGSRAWAPRLASTSWSQNTALPGREGGCEWLSWGLWPRPQVQGELGSSVYLSTIHLSTPVSNTTTPHSPALTSQTFILMLFKCATKQGKLGR